MAMHWGNLVRNCSRIDDCRVCLCVFDIWQTGNPGLATVCSDVGPTVRAVVIGVLARIDHVRYPEAWPTDEQT